MLSESPPYVVRGARGPRSRPTPGSAKAQRRERWPAACPKPLLQPRPQVLDLPYSASADSQCPKPPGCGQLPFFSAGKPVSGEHEQSGSAKEHVRLRGTNRTPEPWAGGTIREETGVHGVTGHPPFVKEKTFGDTEQTSTK